MPISLNYAKVFFLNFMRFYDMKRIIVLLFFTAFFISCTGDQGPAGPQGETGPQGPEGPAGATIVYITGSISSGNYDGNWIEIEDSSLVDSAVTQVFVSPDQTTYAWVSVDFQFGEGIVYIYDSEQEILGWDYLIMIIVNAGD
jgi:hypothetical protein